MTASAIDTGLTVTPLAGALGARVEGVQLASCTEAEAGRLQALLLEHLVIVLPAQQLPATGLAEFGSRWGELHVHPAGSAHPDRADVLVLDSDEGRPRQRFRQTSGWHSDVSWHQTPPKITVLHAQVVPPFGGDTIFANQYLALDLLSPPLRALAGGLRAVHTAERFGARTADVTPVTHPVVRTHPDTGRKALYVNPVFTARLRGMAPEDSAVLLQRLYAAATIPELCYRHRWTAGDIVMWDNRCVLHYAVNDYDGPRVMHRITILGEAPE